MLRPITHILAKFRCAAIVAFLALASHEILAAGTAAGTDISNTASVAFSDPFGVTSTVSSNTSLIRVHELLDVTLVANIAANLPVSAPQNDAALSFTLTNIGNGAENFRLAFNNLLGGDQFDPVNTRIYLDDGDSLFSVATDPLYVPGVNDPLLTADTARVIFVVSDIPTAPPLANGNIGSISLQVEAVTALATVGADAPGVTFAGQGANGTDALVGSSQADASVTNGYVVTQVTSTLAKSQVVLDAFGGSSPISGATITYTLVFNVTGLGNLLGALIVDPIPAATTYVAGSLTLNGLPLSDATDADPGRLNGAQIEVNLGTVAAPISHTVTFRVTIN